MGRRQTYDADAKQRQRRGLRNGGRTRARAARTSVKVSKEDGAIETVIVDVADFKNNRVGPGSEYVVKVVSCRRP